jgi:hypothetical protein
MAPVGALDQLGQALSQIIHAFAEVDDNAKIFMAKWDIKDVFLRMDCEEGEEYNFAYVLPQEEGMPITLVVPTSLQMGWVESPPYFFAAMETARDITSDYCDTPVGSLPHHKFAKHVTGAKEFDKLPSTSKNGELFYALEVYVTPLTMQPSPQKTPAGGLFPSQRFPSCSNIKLPNVSTGINKSSIALPRIVAGWPDFIGVVNASSHGVGGVIIGKLSECLPTVFQAAVAPRHC